MCNIQDVYDKFEKYLQVEKRKDVPSISYFSMEYGLLTCTFIIEIYYKFIIFVMLLFSEPSGMLVYNIL